MVPAPTALQNPHHQLVDRRLPLLAARGPALLLGMPLGRYSGRLLDDDQVRVLKQDLDVVRIRRGIAGLSPDLHDVAGLEFAPFIETQVAVDLHVAIFDQSPHRRPRLAWEELAQRGDEGQAGVLGSDVIVFEFSGHEGILAG
jgi:hypothetical protein